MRKKNSVSRAFIVFISALYFVFSLVLVLAIYYIAPIVILNWFGFFERIGAEIPWITHFFLHKYDDSYILTLITLFISIRFYIVSQEDDVNIKYLMYSNVFKCISYY